MSLEIESGTVADAVEWPMRRQCGANAAPMLRQCCAIQHCGANAAPMLRHCWRRIGGALAALAPHWPFNCIGAALKVHCNAAEEDGLRTAVGRCFAMVVLKVWRWSVEVRRRRRRRRGRREHGDSKEDGDNGGTASRGRAGVYAPDGVHRAVNSAIMLEDTLCLLHGLYGGSVFTRRSAPRSRETAQLG